MYTSKHKLFEEKLTQVKLALKFQGVVKSNTVFLLAGFFSLSLFLALASPQSVAAFDGGDGSSGTPYQISTCVQLQSITNLSAYYELTGSIDCSDTVNWNSGQGFATIPSSGSFTGSFDGNGNTISGLYINRPTSFQGMFRTLGAGANVRDFTITGAQVTSTSNSGILAGTLSGNPAITDVSISGTLSSTAGSIGMAAGSSTGAVLTRITTSGSVTSSSTSGAYVGGIIGEAGSTGVGTQIIDSSSSANVSSASNSTGGLVGGAYFGSYNASTQLISGSYATGSVTNTGTGQAGGLVGQTTNYRIYRSYATGTVTGTGFSGTGGLTGTFSGSGEIVESYATGNVTATGSNQTVGGLVGSFGVSTSIVRSFAVGNARGETRVGGLIGASGGGSITDSYARGRATATTGSPVGSVSSRGTGTISRSYGTGLLTSSGTKFGLAGDASFTPTCNDSFWDTQTTVVATTVCGGTGKTTSEMQNVATFTNTSTSTGLTNAWDFAGTQNNDAGNNDYWDIDPAKNDGYPFLTWQTVWPAVPSPNTNPTVSTLGPTAYVNSSWGTDNTPSLTFTLADSDGGDTVRYQIQIDDTSSFASPVVNYTSALATTGSKTFTVGQSAGTGTYTVGSSGQTLANGTYYWRVKAIDSNSAESSYSTANSGAIAFGIDTAGPTTPGTPSATTPTNDTTPTWTWTASTDSGSGLANPAYTMSWSQTPDFSSGVSAASSNTNSYTHSIALSAGTWYFRVTAWDALNQSSTVSASGSMLVDTTAPTLGSVTPTHNSTGVAMNANLVIEFSETVAVNSGNVIIKQSSNDATIETVAIGSGQVTGTGTDTITVNPSVNFAENTSYYIQITSGALRDSAGNNFEGISDESWSFTTVDLEEPEIVYPGNNTAGNLVGFTIAIHEQPLAGSTTLVFTGDQTVTLTLDNLAVGTHEFILDPADPTAISQVVASSAVSIPDGTYSVVLSHQDASGIATLSSASTTGISIDTTAPTLQSVTPADNASNIAVDTDLVMEFNEPVGAASGEILIKKKSNNSVAQTLVVGGGVIITGNGTDTLTIDPFTDLEPGITYYVEVPSIAVRDLSGNDFAGFSGSSTWTFTTANPNSGKIAPAMTDITLEEGESQELGLLLDEPIIGGPELEVSVESSDSSRATVSPALITFPAASWNESQEFLIETVDDDIINGDTEVTITVTGLEGIEYYAGYEATINLTVIDNEDNPDEDNDGTLNEIEEQAPNSGDGNNDGTPDAQQANVVSFVNDVTDNYATLAVDDVCTISQAAVGQESANISEDTAYDYPVGLMNFIIDCGTPGFTATVQQYYYGVEDSLSLVRKYNPSTGAYFNLTGDYGATIENEQETTIVSYQITDGSELDMDGSVDGSISDPAGLAMSTVGAPDTGLKRVY